MTTENSGSMSVDQAMRRISNGNVALGILPVDGPSVDAFGRLRTSNPFTIFDSKFLYTTLDDVWITKTNGATASIAHLPNEASIQLTVGTVSGESVIRQTRQYHQYIPGKSQYINITGLLGAAKEGVTQRLGYFDDNNGLFFEQTIEGLFIVQRTKTSGTVVNIRIHQNDATKSSDGVSTWNLDAFDGSKKPRNPSRMTLDPSNAQIFSIDFQWLGVGRVRMGLSIDGKFFHCHQFLNANSINSVYMSTPNLPIRYQLENTATTASGTIMKQICSVVQSEGGYEPTGFGYSANTGIAGRSFTTRTPIISIRLKDSFKGVDNRAIGLLQRFNLLVASANILYEIVHEEDIDSILTGASWVSAHADSAVEYDISATAIGPTHNIDSGYVPSGQGSFAGSFVGSDIREIGEKHISFHQNFDSSSSAGMSLVGTSLAGAINAWGSLGWREVF